MPSENGPGVERVFVAVWLPDVVAHSLRTSVKRLLDTEAGAEQSPADRYHVTLRYLGDVAEREVELLVRQLTERLAAVPMFELRIDGAGRFAERRIVWARLAPSTGLMSLERVVSGVAEECIPRIGRRTGAFRPHVTLARRVPTARRLDELLMERCRSTAFQVRHVEVVSHPSDDRYRRIARIRLGGTVG